MSSYRKDLTGMRFGRLCVIGKIDYGLPGPTLWRLRCDCGNELADTTHSLSNTTNKKHSCGCLRREITGAKRRTHGGSGAHPLYSVWCGMINRCTNQNDKKSWMNYGGRGITVCNRWRNDFAAFAADMGERPSPKHQLDRRDNNGPYSPDNCRWATSKEQASNRRVRRDSRNQQVPA